MPAAHAGAPHSRRRLTPTEKPSTLCAMFKPIALLTLLLFLAAAPAWASTVRDIKVSDNDGRYSVSFDAVVDVPADQALRMMLSPGLWPRLAPVIVDATVLSSNERGPHVVRITLHDCVLFFCKTIHKTENITVTPHGHIETLAIPEYSDFSYAREDWHIFAEGGRTHIHYESDMTPSFYLPPLIGAYIIKSRMRSLLTHTAANLEKQAGSATGSNR